MATVQKITDGFVIQTFDTDTGKCIAQEFMAGAECVWEDHEKNHGEVIDEPSNAEYCCYDMVQPKNNA